MKHKLVFGQACLVMGTALVLAGCQNAFHSGSAGGGFGQAPRTPAARNTLGSSTPIANPATPLANSGNPSGPSGIIPAANPSANSSPPLSSANFGQIPQAPSGVSPVSSFPPAGAFTPDTIPANLSPSTIAPMPGTPRGPSFSGPGPSTNPFEGAPPPISNRPGM